MSGKSAAILHAEANGGKVFVGNLRKFVDKSEVESVFARFGTVLNVWVAQNPPGFAFVTFEHPDDASKAVFEMNGKIENFCEANGKGLRVEVSTSTKKTKRDHRGNDRKDSRDMDRRRDRGRDDSRRGGGRRRERRRDSRDDSRSRDRRRRGDSRRRSRR